MLNTDDFICKTLEVKKKNLNKADRDLEVELLSGITGMLRWVIKHLVLFISWSLNSEVENDLDNLWRLNVVAVAACMHVHLNTIRRPMQSWTYTYIGASAHEQKPVKPFLI